MHTYKSGKKRVMIKGTVMPGKIQKERMKERRREKKQKVRERETKERKSESEAVKACMRVSHAHVTLVSRSLMEEQTQISLQGPALHLSLSSFHLLHKLPLTPSRSLS